MKQLIDIQSPVERAFLVGAPRKGSDDAVHVDEHLEELERLADTAGAQVIGRAIQRIEAPTSNFYLGQGKVEELKDTLAAAGATLMLFDENLTPVQGSKLEKHLGVRVMDRTEVILDIFATRARSSEAKLQVELAQLEYLLPRLTRMWTHLSRIRGGIGLRGPGETQLETDRRRIRSKISVVKRRLAEVAEHRANQRQGRRDLPTAALVGYTNAGKSSLLKALSGQDVFIEDRLFATVDTLAREVDVGEGYRYRLTDTVGFIRKLPHHLVASFRATLEEAEDADLLLHVIDASHPGWEEQVDVAEKEMRNAELGTRNNKGTLERKRVIYVFNKADLLPDPEGYLAWVRKGRAVAAEHPLRLSHSRKPTIDEVQKVVTAIVDNYRDLVENKGLWKELWAGNKPRPEKSAQRIFFAVADAHCLANNLDISPEADSGSGPVDFKVSSSYKNRVLVEVKLSTNNKVVHGYETQLATYKKAESTTRATYMVIDVGQMGQKDKRIIAIQNAKRKSGDPVSSIAFVNGKRQESASRRRG